MSKIENDSVTSEDTITHTDLNAKFDDFETLTNADINQENVRSKGIDTSNMDYGGANFTDIILRSAKKQTISVSPGSGTTYNNSSTGQTFTEINHGTGSRITYGVSGQELADGDVLRDYFQVWVDDMVDTVTTTGYRRHPCWLVWLQWDITDNTLTNWEPVPNQDDFDDAYPLDAFSTFDVYGAPVAETNATMVIPHMLRYLDNTATPQQMTYDNLSLHRAYHYKNETGSPITIYGIRLVIDGLYYPWYTSNVQVNRFCHLETDSFTDSIDIGSVRHIAIIERGS